jgi:two-component system sensor histidine kinase PhoQ
MTQRAFRGERGDLLELLGNLLDNAYKWADSRVVVSAAMGRRGDTDCLTLRIEDDGPGIAAGEVARLLRRGERGELPGGRLGEGHGIGLAVVREVAAVYGGEVRIGRGELGGLRIQLDLPAATAGP